MSVERQQRVSSAGGASQAHLLHWPHSKLERRLVAAVIAIVIVSMAVFGLLDYHATRRRAMEDLAARSEQAVVRLQYSLANPLWSYSEEAASAYLRGEMQDEDLIAIVVTDVEENGVWMAYSRGGEQDEPKRVESAQVLRSDIEEAYGTRSRSISYEGIEIGEVRVFFRDDTARAEIMNRLAATVSVTLLLGLLIAVFTTILLHRMVVSPLQSLLKKLDRVGVGDYDVFSESHRDDDIGIITAGFERMVSTIAEREASLRASAKEKEAMLREIHHRVKNNFQILSSLLNLQKRNVPSGALGALEDSEHRIRSMEMVHEKLYESPSLAHIRTAGYIGELVDLLRRSHGIDNSRVAVEAEDRDVPLDMAVPLGLIINETVSNALKHGCALSEKAKVYVSFEANDRIAILRVRDTGPGLSQRSEGAGNEHLGLQLVDALSGQLGGTVETVSDGGVCVTVTFPFDTDAEADSDAEA